MSWNKKEFDSLHKLISEMEAYAKTHTELEYVTRYNGYDEMTAQHAFYNVTGFFLTAKGKQSGILV